MKGTQSCPNLCDSMDSVVQNPPGQNTGVGSCSLLQGNLPNPGIKLKSPALQADSLPSKPWVKPRNTRVGSLSLLQAIFLTQESNQVLLHCGWILYQLSYQGSPTNLKPQLFDEFTEWSFLSYVCMYIDLFYYKIGIILYIKCLLLIS